MISMIINVNLFVFSIVYIIMDSKDYQLLNELVENGRKTNLDLSNSIKLAPSATLGRIKTLEDTEIITGYSARIDHNKVGISLICFMNIQIERNNFIDEVAKELCEIEEVLEVYEVMGSASYFVKIAAENNNDAQRIIKRIGQIKHVKNSESFLVFNQLKYRSARIPKSFITKPDRKPRKAIK